MACFLVARGSSPWYGAPSMNILDTTTPMDDVEAAADNLDEVIRERVPNGPERWQALDRVKELVRWCELGLEKGKRECNSMT